MIGVPADAGNLIVTEMNYHPAPPTAAELALDATLNDDDFEWIEVRNIGGSAIDLSGANFADGINFEIPVGTVLQPNAHALFVENQRAFELRHGTGLPVIGTYANKLNNDGESLLLLGLSGSPIADFVFNDVWYQETDGMGSTLVLRNDSSPPTDYSDALSWRASSQIGGTPGVSETPSGENFSSWQSDNFTAAELADPLIGGPLGDPDGDSLTNLLEYGMGLDPGSPNFDSLPESRFVMIEEESFLSLEFRRQKDLSDVVFSVEISDDLVTWRESAIVVGSPINNADGTETIIVRDILPVSRDEPRLMIRLKVSLTQ